MLFPIISQIRQGIHAYHIRQTSDKILSLTSDKGSRDAVTSTQDDELPPPSTETVQRLNEVAISKLAAIVRKGENQGYDIAEVAAVRSLLDQTTQKVNR